MRQEIESGTHREVSVGAVYATLDRLEKKGYEKSWFGEPTPSAVDVPSVSLQSPRKE